MRLTNPYTHDEMWQMRRKKYKEGILSQCPGFYIEIRRGREICMTAKSANIKGILYR